LADTDDPRARRKARQVDVEPMGLDGVARARVGGEERLGLVARLGEQRRVDADALAEREEEQRAGGSAPDVTEGPREPVPERVEAEAREDRRHEHLREREALL